MSDLYLFIPAALNADQELTQTPLSWVYTDVTNELKLVNGMLSDVASTITNQRVIVVLDGEAVLSLLAEVPGKNIQRVQQAVPYVLEDSVIDDVDELYFAINKSKTGQADNQYNVAVINKAYFESVVAELEHAGIYADVLTADYLLLKEENTLFSDGTRVLFNSEKMKCATDINNASSIIDVESLNFISCAKETDSEPLEPLLCHGDTTRYHCDAEPAMCLVKNAFADNAVNLLQGSYKKKKNWSETGKTWLPLAALFLLWLGIQGGLFIYDYIHLSKQNKVLNNKITAIYKRTFPESRRVIDAKAQMQQKLNSLKKRKGQSGRSFSEMLSGSADIFAKTKGLNIKSLRYYDGRINIEMQIASLQGLDKLKQQLTSEKGYQVEVQNASSGKETVTARIQIVGAE